MEYGHRQVEGGFGDPAACRFEAHRVANAARTAAGGLRLAASAPQSQDELSWIQSSRY